MVAFREFGFLAMGLALVGCARYATPGGPANMRVMLSPQAKAVMTDAPVSQAIDKQPLAKLPASVAVVRVQAPGYRSATAESWGQGAYSIVTTQDIQGEEAGMEKLGKLPMVKGLAPLNRLLLPLQLNSDLELRQAAGALHADMLLMYTLDTSFNVEDVAIPLSVITIGLSPNQVARVTCTASAVLLDTRNGYVYGVAEATDKQKQLANAWTNEAAVDQTRRRVEAEAFSKLVGNLEGMWSGVVNNVAQVQ
jgi:hypothetical protein